MRMRNLYISIEVGLGQSLTVFPTSDKGEIRISAIYINDLDSGESRGYTTIRYGNDSIVDSLHLYNDEKNMLIDAVEFINRMGPTKLVSYAGNYDFPYLNRRLLFLGISTYDAYKTIAITDILEHYNDELERLGIPLGETSPVLKVPRMDDLRSLNFIKQLGYPYTPPHLEDLEEKSVLNDFILKESLICRGILKLNLHNEDICAG